MSRLIAPLLAAMCALVLAVGPAFAQGDDPPDDEPPAAAGDEPAAPDDEPAAAGDEPAAQGDEPRVPPAAGDTDGDGTPDAQDKDDDNDGTPDDQEPPAAPAAGDTDGDGTPDAEDKDDDNDGTPDDQEPPALGTDGVDEDGEPYFDDDSDGDGVVEADELAEAKEFDEAFDDIPDEVSDDALDARPEDAELVPSLDLATFRTLVRLAKRKVLERMEAKIRQKADEKMAKVSWGIFFLSLGGLLLLAMPIFLAKKYPGQGGSLMKYSALAAVTFFVTVNLFGVIMIGMRATQGALSSQTNPQLKIAGGFFDALDHNAEDYIVMGKELFGPTLEQLNGKSDEQPAVVLIENGQKIVEQASVFQSVANMFQKINFVFGVLPIVLFGVTLVLFMLAIKPTLMEIIKLPATAAAGNAGAGGDVVKRAMRRVGGEMIATVCTIGVLTVLTVLAGFILGKVVEPALDSIISYFTLAVTYLQFVQGASTGKVTLMLFSVILFLILNLAVVILSMSFFLGKTQKIFQQRFNEGVPLAAHARWWKWAIPSVILAQVLPWIYLQVAAIGVEKIEDGMTQGVTDAEKIAWTKMMLTGPLFLVIGFLVFFWAARGLKAIGFMAKYKVKLAAPVKPAV